MVRRKTTNSDESSRQDHEDQAMDSMLRELGRAGKNGEAFLGKIKNRIESGDVIPDVSELPQETFFGLAPLTKSIDLDATVESVSLSNEPMEAPVRLGFGSWIAVAVVALVAITAGAAWFLNTGDQVSSDSNSIASAVPDPIPNELIPSVDLSPRVADSASPLPKLQAAPSEGELIDPTSPDELAETRPPVEEVEHVDSAEAKPVPLIAKRIELPSDIPYASRIWNLKINFDKDGVGQAWLNGTSIDIGIPLNNSDKIVADVGHEVIRRFCFLSSGFDSPMYGAVDLECDGVSPGQIFQFESLEQMQEAFNRSSRYLASMKKPEHPSPKLGTGFSAEIASRTEKVLRESFESDFIRDERMFVVLAHQPTGMFKYYRTISIDELDQFVSTGELKLPNPGEAFVQRASIHSREADALKEQLRDVTSVGLFKSTKEFTEFERRVLAATPRGKLLAKISELDVELAELSAQQGVLDYRSEKREEIVEQMRPIQREVQEARNKLARLPREPAINQLSVEERKKIQAVTADIGRELSAIFKRRRKTSDFNQIQALDEEAAGLTRRMAHEKRQIILSSNEYVHSEPLEPLVGMLPNRPDLQGLNFVMGDACHLDEQPAQTMGEVSQSAGRVLALFDNFGSRDFSKHGSQRLQMVKRVINQVANGENPEQGLTTLDQMLQMERPELRLELVEALRKNQSPTAVGLLACYAKYDLAPSVRAAATDAMRSFPAESYRAALLEGFSYPWAEVATHSAEALVRLNDQHSVTHLVSLLKTPDPRSPREIEDGFTQRELVSINHMKNCTLCHADSQDQYDHGRGRVPTWEQRLPQMYYQEENGAMVRADVTYLRQDFSVVQKVEKADPWPANQRFDYVVRNKTLSKEEYLAESKKYANGQNDYHAVIDKALRMLTGHDPKDSSYETWSALVGG